MRFSDHRPDGLFVYELSGSGITGAKTVGVLPLGCLPVRIFSVTDVAGTGSSSPTIIIGSSTNTDKYVASADFAVAHGVNAHVVQCEGGIATGEETILATFGGTMPTNSSYHAYLVIEYYRFE